MVAIENKITARAGECPVGQRYLLPVSTPGAILTGVAGIHNDILATSVFSFVSKIGCELSPGCIRNRLGEAMIVNHLVDTKVFNGNDAVLIYDASTSLVGEVRASIGNPLVDVRDHQPGFSPGRGALYLFGKLPLGFRQRLFISTEEAEIGDRGFTGRESGKGSKSDIYANCFFGFRQQLLLCLTGEGDKPLAGAGVFHAAGLELPLCWTMNYSLNIAHFGQIDHIIFKHIADLGIGEAVIPSCAPESGIAWLFPRLHSTKECFEGQVNPHGHILKHLAMNSIKRRAFFLKTGQHFYLVVEAKRLLAVFPSCLSLFQEMVNDLLAHTSIEFDVSYLRADEISVAALSGELADRQKSKAGTSGLGWTDEKLLKGAGAGVVPDEIDILGNTLSAAVASDNLKNSNNDERHKNPTGSYVKIKEVLLNANLEACRIKFDLRDESGGFTSYGQIYKNDGAIGAEQSDNTGIYQTFSEDFAGFVSGNKIQIWVKSVNNPSYIRNMRFYYDKTITTIAGNTLITPLAISDAISMTNQDP